MKVRASQQHHLLSAKSQKLSKPTKIALAEESTMPTDNDCPPPAGDGRPEVFQPPGTAEGATASLPSSLPTRPGGVHPALASQGICESDVAVAVRVLTAVSRWHPKTTPEGGGLEAYRDLSLRPLRKALAGCLEVHKLTMYNGKDEDLHFAEKEIKRGLKRQRRIEKRALQKQKVAKTGLRQGRMNRLAQLQQDQPAHAHLLIADGPVLGTFAPSGGPPLLLESNTTTEPNGNAETHATAVTPEDPSNLSKMRRCYCCKGQYRDLHVFYDQLCPLCAAFNYEKRFASADCSKKVALVMGARVRIGFQTVLKLLRAGATVVATTRFPNDAVDRYRREPDFASFQDRLWVYGVDLRDVTGLETLARALKQKFPGGLDVLVHNAAQTIRRPAPYYLPLVQREQELWRHGDDVHRRILSGCTEFERARRQLDQLHGPTTGGPSYLTAPPVRENQRQVHTAALLPDPSFETADASEEHRRTSRTSASGAMVSTVKLNVGDRDDDSDDTVFTRHIPFETTGISRSAAMSQMVLLPEDTEVSDALFPPGAIDAHGQQLDLRTVNSWILKMDQISTPELMECMFINAIAPFVLNSRLVPLMYAGPDDSRPDRFIVNVSAMEGKFNRYKRPNHPHTNMAKAALNMMTRTAAGDLARRYRIYMNSVDTGWVSDQNPLERAKRYAENDGFQPPIDEIDAAARILDPVFSRIRGDDPLYGRFLKNYKKSDW